MNGLLVRYLGVSVAFALIVALPTGFFIWDMLVDLPCGLILFVFFALLCGICNCIVVMYSFVSLVWVTGMLLLFLIAYVFDLVDFVLFFSLL